MSSKLELQHRSTKSARESFKTYVSQLEPSIAMQATLFQLCSNTKAAQNNINLQFEDESVENLNARIGDD